MFENPGKKLFLFAIIELVLGTLGALGAGIYLWVTVKGWIGFLLFLAAFVGGGLTAWISFHFIRAWGEATENAVYTANRLYELSFEVEEQGRILKDIRQLVDPNTNPAIPLKTECPQCGLVNDGARSICIRCGAPLREEWWAKPPRKTFRQ